MRRGGTALIQLDTDGFLRMLCNQGRHVVGAIDMRRSPYSSPIIVQPQHHPAGNGKLYKLSSRGRFGVGGLHKTAAALLCMRARSHPPLHPCAGPLASPFKDRGAVRPLRLSRTTGRVRASALGGTPASI